MKKVINTAKAPSPIGPYNQAIISGNTLYISGQIAMNASTGNLVKDDIQKETDQCMQNLKSILTKANMSFENVVKASIFLTDMSQFSEVNKVYGSYFNTDTAPARETIEVANLPKYVNVEISMIAVQK